jgi:hypothetical protein
MTFEAIIEAEIKRRYLGEEKDCTYRCVDVSTVESVSDEVSKRGESNSQ